jgi:hypothetical protein
MEVSWTLVRLHPAAKVSDEIKMSDGDKMDINFTGPLLENIRTAIRSRRTANRQFLITTTVSGGWIIPPWM